MEKSSCFPREDEQLELPPGFRFHPTDEELITHYLSPKVLDYGFTSIAIGEVDLNKVEPWDLPWKAKMGEKEWYFFCVRDRKYPTGLRTNRATESGYWKATGKDKEIHRAKTLVGMKKTLVFYRGRAPKGEKTNWVMHEYRLDGKHTIYNSLKSSKNEWVISRIFNKSSGGKKTHISGLIGSRNCGDEIQPCNLPPLLDMSTCDGQTQTPVVASSSSSDKCSASLLTSKSLAPNSMDSSPQIFPSTQCFQFPYSFPIQDQSMLKNILENNGMENCKAELSGMSTDVSSAMSYHEIQRSFEDQDYQFSSSAPPLELDYLWDY